MGRPRTITARAPAGELPLRANGGAGGPSAPRIYGALHTAGDAIWMRCFIHAHAHASVSLELSSFSRLARIPANTGLHAGKQLQSRELPQNDSRKGNKPKSTASPPRALLVARDPLDTRCPLLAWIARCSQVATGARLVSPKSPRTLQSLYHPNVHALSPRLLVSQGSCGLP